MPPSTRFDSLYESYERLVRAVVRRTLAARGYRDQSAVDDLTQSVWTECWKQLQAGAHCTKAWLVLRTQSRTQDFLAANSTREISLEALASKEDGDDCATPEVYVEPPITRVHPLKESIASLVDELPAGQRRAIELTFYLGLSPKEAATKMKISHAAVRQHISRAITTLRGRVAVGHQEVA